MNNKIGIIQYFEEVRNLYEENDVEGLQGIREKYGDLPTTYDDVESLVAHVFAIMAGFQVAMEMKDQAHFDMVLNALEKAEILSSKQLNEVKELDQQMNDQLENVEEDAE